MGDPSVSVIDTACQWIYFQCIACQRSINSQLFGDIQKVVRIFLPKPVSGLKIPNKKNGPPLILMKE